MLHIPEGASVSYGVVPVPVEGAGTGHCNAVQMTVDGREYVAIGTEPVEDGSYPFLDMGTGEVVYVKPAYKLVRVLLERNGAVHTAVVLDSYGEVCQADGASDKDAVRRALRRANVLLDADVVVTRIDKLRSK